MVRAAVAYRHDAFLWTGGKATSLYTLPSGNICMVLGGPGYSLPYRLDYSRLDPVRGFPWHVGPCTSIVAVQILRELGMRQAIYAPVFKNPDWATFTAEMKTKILQFVPSTC